MNAASLTSVRRLLTVTAATLLTGAALSLPPVTARADDHGAAKDIVDTAVAAGSFNTLVTAVKAAGLVDALKGEGPLTVFAPTDAAFAKLPAGVLDNLLKPENVAQLKSILLYHVVPGKIMAADIDGVVKPATLEGAALDVIGSAKGVTVNGANVVSADVAASNGVIHVIDEVVLPPTG
jgi:uncharacterized surface protein with fasciclin (FAS1) repeats